MTSACAECFHAAGVDSQLGSLLMGLLVVALGLAVQVVGPMLRRWLWSAGARLLTRSRKASTSPPSTTRPPSL